VTPSPTANVLILAPVKNAAHGARHSVDRLLMRADCRHNGLIWPAYPYGLSNPLIRTDPRQIGRPELGEIETEGLGMMAHDMGLTCWGLPDVEIRHR